MGKVGRRRADVRRAPQPLKTVGIARRAHSIPSRGGGKAVSKIGKSNTHHGKASSVGNDGKSKAQGRPRWKIPFGAGDRVLLVGEGDFSFALSLAQSGGVESIVATSYDTRDALFGKYPHAEHIINALLHLERQVPVGSVHDDRDDFVGFSPPTSPKISGPDSASRLRSSSPSPVEDVSTRPQTSVYHGVDATKLSSTHRKLLRRHGPFTKIVFNFPHVGGLSTDVNRQTRANQQLIQAFFGAASNLLASPTNPIQRQQFPATDLGEDQDLGSETDKFDPVKPGQILVTLFEGEAYTDWNIKDIARSQALRVVESFRFPWAAYPGYRHARTIGEVQTGKDRGDEGKRKGAWRGEEREARCFVFEANNHEQSAQNRSRKRRGDRQSDSESN